VLALIIVVIGAWSRDAGAQIVNVQGQLAKAPEADGVTGQLELKLDWRQGNTSVFDIGASGAVIVRHGRLLALALARGEYGESRDVTFTRKSFEHLRARYTIDCRWRWEVFVQHEYDAFRRLSVRGVAGTGPALQIVQRPSIAILAGAAYLFELERLDTRPGTIDAGERSVAHRSSLYVTGIERIGEQVSVLETVYVQPRLDDFDDIRLLGELTLTSKLAKHVALTNGLTVAYDRTPPDGVERYDMQLKVAVLVTF
jgi:hypothetical protein